MNVDEASALRPPATEGPDSTRPASSTRRVRRGRLMAAAAAGVLLAAAVVVGLSLRAAQAHLEEARASAEAGADALLAAEVEQAEAAFTASEAAFDRAAGRLENPLVRLTGGLPVAGPNLDTVTGLTHAGGLAARAGATAAGAVADLPGGVGALAPASGALPVEALRALGPPLAETRALLDEASVALEATPSEGLVEQVAAARAVFSEQLDQAVARTAAAEPLVQALPGFLGVDGPKRYFFGAAQPAELRGATGFIGAYAILTLDRGAFSFSDFGPIQDLPLTQPDVVPPPNPDFPARYGAFGGTGYWQNLNLSPDFPTTGTAIERLWQHTFGEPLDGVIAADPFALAALLDVAGPVEIPGVGAVDADTVVPFVSNEAYDAISDPEQRKRLLGEVAAAALQGFLAHGLETPGEGEVPASALGALRALGEAAGDGHLVVHVADPEAQAAFEAAGLAGRLLDPDGDYFAAVLNGASGSKIDYYLGRELDYRVDLQPGGVATAQAELRLANDAPASGQSSYIIGPNTDRLEAGENEVYVSVYLASGAELTGFLTDGQPGAGALETELSHPVVETFERLPSGGRRTLTYDIAHADAWTEEREGGRYRLTLQEQASIRPTLVSIEVRLPEGMELVEADERFTQEGDVLRFRGEVRGDFEAEVRFARPTPQRSAWQRVRDWLAAPVVTF